MMPSKKIFLILFLLLFITDCFAQSSVKPIVKDKNKQLYRTSLNKDNDEAIIGDENSAVFKPEITFTKWNKENSLRIKPSIGLATQLSSAITTFAGNKVEHKNGKVGWYANPDPDNADNFKFGIILYEKPLTNTWSFQLEGWEEFDFYYQYPYPIVNPDGSTQIKQKGERGYGYRPPNVTGSYAIYHKNKKDNGYKTGKFGHIYRPKFIDANGNWVWGSLHIDSGIYTVTCPQSFLDNAVYPVKANDTFGNTHFGSGDGGFGGADGILLGQFTANGNGSVTSITVGSNYDSGIEFKACIYSDGGNSHPANKLGNSVEGSTPQNTWVTVNMVSSVSITSGTLYWLGIFIDNGSGNFGGDYDYPYDTGTTERLDHSTDSLTYPTFPGDPINVANREVGRIWSIYATYTPAARRVIIIE